MALKEKDIKKIWGLSGGICAKCKTELFKDDEIIGEQAHCIARKDKNLESFKDIPIEEKDRYENILLLCASCHEETENWSSEELLRLKYEHEESVRDTLRGKFHPYEIGKGKLFNRPFITYTKYEFPYNVSRSKKIIRYFFVFSCILCTIVYYTSPIFYFFLSLLGCIGLIICLFVMHLKKPMYLRYIGKCTFSGCGGDVHIKESSVKIRNISKFIGVCDKDHLHTFTVSEDKTRGDYHDFSKYY